MVPYTLVAKNATLVLSFGTILRFHLRHHSKPFIPAGFIFVGLGGGVVEADETFIAASPARLRAVAAIFTR